MEGGGGSTAIFKSCWGSVGPNSFKIPGRQDNCISSHDARVFKFPFRDFTMHTSKCTESTLAFSTSRSPTHAPDAAVEPPAENITIL